MKDNRAAGFIIFVLRCACDEAVKTPCCLCCDYALRARFVERRRNCLIVRETVAQL